MSDFKNQNATKFKSLKANTFKSIKTQRDNVQTMIELGMTLYNVEGDTAWLTEVLQGCVNVKALPTKTISDYIRAHANVVVKAKTHKTTGEKSYVFGKEKKGAPVKVKEIKQTWYDWGGAKHNDPEPMDWRKGAKALLTRMKTNMEKGTIKEQEKAQEFMEALANDLAALEA